MSAGRSRDDELVRRAARRIGLQAAVLVWAAFGICGGVLLALVLHAQQNSSAATLRSAVERADDVTDPPDGTWLAVEDAAGRLAVSPGAPAFLPARSAPVGEDGVGRSFDVHTATGEYRVLTERRNGRFVQAARSLAAEHAERTRLIEALLVSGAVAVVFAGAVGAVAGRRWVAPLADALARQRTFVADASHELRTPLTRLTTRAQMVERSLTRGDAMQARAESGVLVADGLQLAAVLEDLLAAAEPTDESGWSLLDLDDLVAEGVAAASIQAEDAAVRLEAIPGDRPVPGEPVTVRGPRAALDRALLALLDNAIRHSPPTEPVQVTVAADRRWATLSVTNGGPGISAAEQAHVFDRFTSGPPAAAREPRHRDADDESVPQAAAAPRRFGLGLALVADTAQRLGGDIQLRSGTTGTTMTIRLPRAGVQFGD
ncbi:MAG TPA: HAMP domain-containing sensor histidine kinase [Frankiaceae bacterium]|nr:HAMP domain-containing sensor histidine kinase [Frankiaceae bacterium]